MAGGERNGLLLLWGQLKKVHEILEGTEGGGAPGQAPRSAAAGAGKTGLSELPPSFDPKKPGFPDWSGWSRKVKVDLPALNAYAQAVYAASDDYLASLRGKDPGPPVDLAAP